MEQNGCYTNLPVNERINAKNWVNGLTNGRMHSVLGFCLGWKKLPPKLADNIDEPYTKEALLKKKNWMIYKL